MPKTKSAFSIVLILMVVLTGAYVCAVIFKSTFLSGALSPLNAAVSGCILLYTYIRSDRKQRVNLTLLLLSMGCFSWMLADVFWAVLILQEKDPAQNILISLGYFIPNIVFGAGIIYIGYCHYNKWRSIKNVIEALTIGLLSVFFIWITFFNKEEAVINLLTSHGVIYALLIFFDLFVFIELLILFISEYGSHIPYSIRIIASGIFIFFTTNFIYYHCIFNNIYYVNSIIQVLYIVSLVLMAIGALLKTLTNGSFINLSVTDDAGKSRWAYFLVFPVISVTSVGFHLIDLVIFAGIIALYYASVKYIRLAKENEKLLENEFSINANLEKRIKEQLQELTVLANQDTVTQLNNRRYFSVLLDEAIKTLNNNEMLAVLQFDVDRFKTINDSYGHDVGDKVIVEISNRLIEWNKTGAVLARLGGDEFAVLLRGGLTRHELGEYSKQVIEICGAPIYVDHQALYLTISIGISSCPRDARDSVTLMKNSDIAMYMAKAEGYNKYVFYSPLFKANISRKNQIEALLRNADLQTEFELVYQPQFTLPDKRLIGAEALIRWKSAEHGYIPPSVFVPVAEEINYINRIGKWVLFKAVEQIIRWNTDFSLHLKMGINISPRQLSEDDFFMTLKTLITTNQINTSWIDAEITENLMIEGKSKVKSIFDLFKELDISVSIDDFGSGYSSLGYLNKYHFDRIKIDKSLIDNLTAPGGSGLEVVKAIITMSNAVGKVTIAEGVETKEQLEILSQLGCKQVQGYLLGKPVPAEDFVRKFIERDFTKVQKIENITAV